jgi:hypothetical protein
VSPRGRTGSNPVPGTLSSEGHPSPRSGLPESDHSALIVTGISRSGTSYLCNLLHRFDNCVAINEPRQAISLLREEEVPWGMAAYYDKVRRDVRAGRHIENKIHRGQVIQDTARHERRRWYRPTVASADFVLAVKNTREFLLRLDALRSVMPAARIVACVRNPLDAVASWKRSFPHLRDADVGPFVRHPECMWLPAEQRETLASIAATPSPAERRALWWRFQAERVLEHRRVVMLVRYEELAADPLPVLGRILAGFDAGGLRTPIRPSSVRSSRRVLDDDDLVAISEICSPAAAQLGLAVPAEPR